jgi:hypothetical protein
MVEGTKGLCLARRHPQTSAPPVQFMAAADMDAVDERLAIFDDEPDINDWVEVMSGAAMVLLGLFHMFSPGDLVNPETMQWFAATVAAAGFVWIGHGLKDMAVKEIRRSVAMLDETTSAAPDHGLIRDVLLNPEAYRDFLLDAYQQAWEDGVITEEEMKELRSFQSALGLSDEEMDEISEQAKSTTQDSD